MEYNLQWIEDNLWLNKNKNNSFIDLSLCNLTITKSPANMLEFDTEEPLLVAKLSPSQPANPQLGAEIALLSQLWGTTLHPPYTLHPE